MALCSRNADYYEKISDPLDLSTIEKQILIGYYKTVEAFDADMLKVFRNAEVFFIDFKYRFKRFVLGVPAVVQRVNDPACLCGISGSIPSPVQWVKDLVLLQL